MRHVVLLAALLAAALGACARSVEPGETMPAAPDAIQRELFSADLLVAQQDSLGLSDAQRVALRDELARGRAELAQMNAPLGAARNELAAALAGSTVDEATALRLATRVTELEAGVKLAHLRMLVRLKNLLTPAQQARLRSSSGAPTRASEPAETRDGAR
jgi:Spy/CpxP family protein refolding chaperone